MNSKWYGLIISLAISLFVSSLFGQDKNEVEVAKAKIDSLVADLCKDCMWQNGAYVPMDLPSTATPTEVADAYMASCRTTHYKIVATKDVSIPQSLLSMNYTALVIKTETVEMILLMQYMGGGKKVESEKPLTQPAGRKIVREQTNKNGWWIWATNLK